MVDKHSSITFVIATCSNVSPNNDTTASPITCYFICFYLRALDFVIAF